MLYSHVGPLILLLPIPYASAIATNELMYRCTSPSCFCTASTISCALILASCNVSSRSNDICSISGCDAVGEMPSS